MTLSGPLNTETNALRGMIQLPEEQPFCQNHAGKTKHKRRESCAWLGACLEYWRGEILLLNSLVNLSSVTKEKEAIWVSDHRKGGKFLFFGFRGGKAINVWIYASFVQMCVLKPKIARPKRSFILYKFALASGNGLCTKGKAAQPTFIEASLVPDCINIFICLWKWKARVTVAYLRYSLLYISSSPLLDSWFTLFTLLQQTPVGIRTDL